MKLHQLPIIFALFVFSLNVKAIDGVMLSYGTGMTDILIQSKDIDEATHQAVGIHWGSEFNWQHDIFGYGELEYELYYSKVSLDQDVNIIAFRPVMSFWESTDKARSWYWQFGVGLSYFDSKTLLPIELSTNAQFATVFGLGMVLDKNFKHRLSLRYNHYSNAYLKTPNQGLDTLSLDWHVTF